MKKYIIKKYILADSIHQAMRLEKTAKPDDIYLDSASEPQISERAPLIGFDTSREFVSYSPILKKKRKAKK